MDAGSIPRSRRIFRVILHGDSIRIPEFRIGRMRSINARQDCGGMSAILAMYPLPISNRIKAWEQWVRLLKSSTLFSIPKTQKAFIILLLIRMKAPITDGAV